MNWLQRLAGAEHQPGGPYPLMDVTSRILQKQRRAQHRLVSGETFSIAVRPGTFMRNIEVFAIMNHGGVSPVFALEARFIPRDPEATPGGLFHRATATTTTTDNLADYVYMAQAVQEFRRMSFAAVGGAVFESVPLPQGDLREGATLSFVFDGGAADTVDLLIFWDEVEERT